MGFEHTFKEVESRFRGCERFREPVFDALASGCCQWTAHAAGNGPGGMNLFPAQHLDDLLPELPEADSCSCEVGIGGDEAEHVALLRWAVPAQQQVRCAQMEEAQGVALNKLGKEIGRAHV